MTYQNTLITVSDDCPVLSGQAPAKVGVASFQYQLLQGQPYQYTQDEVLFRSHYRNENGDWEELKRAHWQEFFSQPRACLRASPLPKKFGWGFHFDAAGKVALLALESPEYQQLLAGQNVKVVKAMRSKRA